MAGSPTPKKHILLITVPAFGHIIPLLELGRKLSQDPNFLITFAISEFMLEGIQRRELIPPNSAFSIIPIPDGYFEEDEVKPGRTMLIFNRIQSFVIPGVKKFFAAIPSQHKPNGNDALGVTTPVDVVIADNMLSESLFALDKRGIPFYLFNTASSAMVIVSLMINASTPTDGKPDELDIPFAAVTAPEGDAPKPIPDMAKKLFLPMHEITLRAKGIIGNSVYEFESKTIDEIRAHPELRNVSFHCAGPLMPVEKMSQAQTETQEKIVKWLDNQEKHSVIYVSFGSVALLKPEDFQEIVKALLATGKSFIWSLPQKEHFRLPEAILSSIPGQFDGDVAAACLIVSWAPQKLILQHPSTAVFISHCGWNSTVESLATGVPVVAWPMFGDQNVNAIELVKKGSGLRIEGTGLVSKNVILAKTIQDAIEQTAGFGNKARNSKYRDAAEEWKEKLNNATGQNGSTGKDLADLCNQIRLIK